MGRNSDECGASVDTFILTHRIRQQAGLYGLYRHYLG